MQTSRFRAAALLLILSAAVVIPMLGIGFVNERRAEAESAAGDHAGAARDYASAARILFWQEGLWEKAGVSAEAFGDHAGAIAFLTNAGRRQPLNASGYEAFGSAYWATGDRASAVAFWETGAQAYPGDASLLGRLVDAYRAQGNYTSEQDALRRRLAVSGDAEAHYLLGTLLVASDPVAARTELQAAAEDSQFGPAAKTLLAAVSAGQAEADPAKQLVLIGRGLGLVNEWRLARDAFAKAAAVNPRSAEAYAWLGEAKQHAGDDGRPDLDRALRLGPRDSLVHVLRGVYFRRIGATKEAVAEYASAVELEPDNPVLLASLGQAQAESGDLAAALGTYQKATEISPNTSRYWQLLAMFCADNAIQVLEIGIPAAEKAAALAPRDGGALDALGWTYAQAGYLTKAERTLRDAVPLSTEPALVHLHLGQVYLQAGERSAAFDELRTVVRIDADGPYSAMARRLLDQFFVVPSPTPGPLTP